MISSLLDLTPFIPSDQQLGQSGLADKALVLNRQAAALAGQLHPLTAATLRTHMAVINSYYSNLIEGNRTLPHQIRQAQRGDFSADPATRDLQQESLAHIQVQAQLARRPAEQKDPFQAATLKWIHYAFYAALPEHQRLIRDTRTGEEDILEPGEYRHRQVSVGRHVPPPAEALPVLVDSFLNQYRPERHPGTHKIIAVMAAHHRLLWVHPFLDGNGRTARLWTDEALKAAGLDSVGVWCLSRGLARASDRYKTLLSNADQPRRGDRDGRGALSEAALVAFCDFMLDQALDQVEYIAGLLDLASLRRRFQSYVQARNDGRVPGRPEPLKPAAARVLFAAFQSGQLDRAEALELAGQNSERNNRRLISQLRDEGLLSETNNRSPLQWAIPEHAEPWYFPELAPHYPPQ
tara:strand:+ start:750 stop:1970 length:1221 start_codon:yes stop_codon:yes gene_type:complete